MKRKSSRFPATFRAPTFHSFIHGNNAIHAVKIRVEIIAKNKPKLGVKLEKNEKSLTQQNNRYTRTKQII